MRRCILALGGNLGDRLHNLQDVLRRLPPAITVLTVSPLYESDPVGPPGQPDYFNAVCTGTTALAPEELLAAVKAVERTLGRDAGVRWGPRPADIDILFLDGITRDTPTLTIPHPRIAERGFVLTPLADLLPDLVIPATGERAAAAARRAGTDGLRRIAGPEWPALMKLGTAGDPTPL